MRGVDIWSEAGVSYEQNGNNDVQTANGALSPGNLNGFLNTVSFSTEGYGDNLAAGVASTSSSVATGASTNAASVNPAAALSPAELIQVRKAAFAAAFQDILNVIDPANTGVTTADSVQVQACSDFSAIEANVAAVNGGTAIGASRATVATGINSFLNSQGMSATPNGNTWNGGVPNSNNDWWVSYCNNIDEFFQTNDVSGG